MQCLYLLCDLCRLHVELVQEEHEHYDSTANKSIVTFVAIYHKNYWYDTEQPCVKFPICTHPSRSLQDRK